MATRVAVTLRIAPVLDPDGAPPRLDVQVVDTWTEAEVVGLESVIQGAQETALALPQLEDGSYRWRVRAVDDEGLEGAWSDAWYFAVAEPTDAQTGPYGCTCAGAGPGRPSGLLMILLIGLLLGL